MNAIIQGAYYLATGLWPIIYMPGFLAFTGPKTDLWLVRIVGWLLVVSGVVLIAAGSRRRRRSLEGMLLGLGDAAVLATTDIFFAVTGQVSGVYLLDAAIEIFFLVWWVRFLWKSRRRAGGGARFEEPGSRNQVP